MLLRVWNQNVWKDLKRAAINPCLVTNKKLQTELCWVCFFVEPCSKLDNACHIEECFNSTKMTSLFHVQLISFCSNLPFNFVQLVFSNSILINLEWVGGHLFTSVHSKRLKGQTDNMIWLKSEFMKGKPTTVQSPKDRELFKMNADMPY